MPQGQIETIAADVRAFLDRVHGHFIGGEWMVDKKADQIEVVSPATGQAVSAIQAGTKADVDAAVLAARLAFEDGPWRTMVPSARAAVLFRLADLVENHSGAISQLESIDSGVPMTVMKLIAVKLAADQLRYYAGWVTKINGETITNSRMREEGRDYLAYTTREPVGVVGQIIPWNFPFGMAIQKIAPALAAGCTLVLKPAEETPLTAMYLADLAKEAGVPEGVLNLVNGTGRAAGAAIAAHADVDKIAFTGSTRVGKEIIQASAGNLKKVSLELGGKSPVILMPDADLDAAVPAAARAIFFLSGQNCMAGSRLMVHADIYDEVVERLKAEAEGYSVGADFNGECFAGSYDVGPLVNENQFKRVLSYIDVGKSEGARLVCGGKRVEQHGGYFVSPTIFADCTPDMQIVQEEIFGPVLTVQKFDTDDVAGVAALANDTIYGLSASVWTRDLAKGHKIAARIKSGQVGLNVHAAIDTAVPFGGYKQSGWGREFGEQGLEPYLQTKAKTAYL